MGIEQLIAVVYTCDEGVFCDNGVPLTLSYLRTDIVISFKNIVRTLVCCASAFCMRG